MPGAERGVLVDIHGSRFYTAAALAAVLGVPTGRIAELVRAGLLPAPVLMFGKRVWPEATLDLIQRRVRAGIGNRIPPF
jgi:hypothetical protein